MRVWVGKCRCRKGGNGSNFFLGVVEKRSKAEYAAFGSREKRDSLEESEGESGLRGNHSVPRDEAKNRKRLGRFSLRFVYL